MNADRALSWDEWRLAVIQAVCDRIGMLVTELHEMADASLHPGAFAMIAGWIGELKDAATAGDLTTCEHLIDRIRRKLDVERGWSARPCD